MASQRVRHNWVTFTFTGFTAKLRARNRDLVYTVTRAQPPSRGWHFKNIYLFPGCAGSLLLLHGPSLVAVSGDHRSWRCTASHCRGFSFCGAQALGCVDFSNHSMWAQELRHESSRGHRLQQLGHTDSDAPWHVESSQTGDLTPAPDIGRQTPIDCATREVLPGLTLLKPPSSSLWMKVA